MKRIFYFLLISIFIYSCDEAEDDKVALNKDGSVDIHITDKALDSTHDLIVLHETFYVKGHQLKSRI